MRRLRAFEQTLDGQGTHLSAARTGGPVKSTLGTRHPSVSNPRPITPPWVATPIVQGSEPEGGKLNQAPVGAVLDLGQQRMRGQNSYPGTASENWWESRRVFVPLWGRPGFLEQFLCGRAPLVRAVLEDALYLHTQWLYGLGCGMADDFIRSKKEPDNCQNNKFLSE